MDFFQARGLTEPPVAAIMISWFFPEDGVYHSLESCVFSAAVFPLIYSMQAEFKMSFIEDQE